MQRPDADLFGGDPEQGGVLLPITICLAIAIGCADSSGPLRIFGLEKTGTAQQLFNFYATGAYFVGRAEQVAGFNRISVAAAAVAQSGDVERFDGASYLALSKHSRHQGQSKCHKTRKQSFSAA